MEYSTLKLPTVQFSKAVKQYYPEILTDEALEFLSALHEKFNSNRLQLLSRRVEQQKVFDQGKFPEFPRETKAIREGDWTANAIPEDLQDRHQLIGSEKYPFYR
ncbi:MAG: hypothetical protein DSY83_07385 [Flavobacteriia bacterium]|nr:MAG: hypothetical protein DSY83_07385 [Flavobacteriia bacterium]